MFGVHISLQDSSKLEWDLTNGPYLPKLRSRLLDPWTVGPTVGDFLERCMSHLFFAGGLAKDHSFFVKLPTSLLLMFVFF